MSASRVIIVGQGPAGLACAMTLRKLSLDVLILEGKDEEDYRPGEHLSSLGRQQIAGLGIANELLTLHSTVCWEVQSCWGGSEVSSHESIFDAHGESYVLSRPAFDAALSDHAAAVGVRIRRGTWAVRADWRSQQWHVSARTARKDTHTITCDFIVDASGRDSPFARKLGARSVRYDNLVGVTGFVNVPQGHAFGDHVLVEATPAGWWYSAKLRDRAVATYMTDGDLIRRNGVELEGLWMRRLDEAPVTLARVACRPLLGQVKSRPAHTQCLYPAYGNRWIAIGDAATSFDPLSSQGICKALQDGARGAFAVRDALDGDLDGLSSYARAIQSRFSKYLALRRKYYLSELRWPRRVFWSRRHNQIWPELLLWLAPAQHVSIERKASRDELQQLRTVAPSVNYELLTQAIGGGACSLKVLRRYKLFADPSPDQEIIVALQLLVKTTGTRLPAT